MEENMENIRKFKIKDFYQAVILKTLGFPLVEIERGSGKFVTFVFDDPEFKAEETIERYWNREIKVIARDLIEAINEIKTRIYSRV